MLARILAVTAVVLSLTGIVKAQDRPLEIVGWLERVRIPAYGITLDAKNDTGAKTASLHAENIEAFEKDGEDWVRFDLVVEDGEADDEASNHRTLGASAKVVDDVLIKSLRGPSQRRYVIQLGLCMDHIYREVEVNLSDRSGFSTRLLIGRKFLKGRALVDSDLKFTREPACEDGEE
jgi:hypothetical protein